MTFHHLLPKGGYRVLNTVLKACEGLVYLDVCSSSVDVGLIFYHPNLASLQHLGIRIEGGDAEDEDWEEILAREAPRGNITVHLNSVEVGLSYSTITLLQTFLDASALDRLTYLDLETCWSGDLYYLEELRPIAASIKSLLLPAIDAKNAEMDSNSYFTCLTQSIKHFTSLQHLSIVTDEDSRPTYIPPCLTRLFAAVPFPLESFTLTCDIDYLCEDTLFVFKSAMALSLPLSNLRKLHFPITTLEELETLAGWGDFTSLLKEKGVKLVTKRVK